jgi:hypothetical protein
MVSLPLRLVEGLRTSILRRDAGCRIPGHRVDRIPFTAYFIALAVSLFGESVTGKEAFLPPRDGGCPILRRALYRWALRVLRLLVSNEEPVASRSRRYALRAREPRRERSSMNLQFRKRFSVSVETDRRNLKMSIRGEYIPTIDDARNYSAGMSMNNFYQKLFVPHSAAI